MGDVGGGVDVTGSLEVIGWLAVLEAPGPLFGCGVCQSSTVWRHPVYGGVHPRCVPRAMVAVHGDGCGGEVRVPSVRRRGAYARHG